MLKGASEREEIVGVSERALVCWSANHNNKACRGIIADFKHRPYHIFSDVFYHLEPNVRVMIRDLAPPKYDTSPPSQSEKMRRLLEASEAHTRIVETIQQHMPDCFQLDLRAPCNLTGTNAFMMFPKLPDVDPEDQPVSWEFSGPMCTPHTAMGTGGVTLTHPYLHGSFGPQPEHGIGVDRNAKRPLASRRPAIIHRVQDEAHHQPLLSAAWPQSELLTKHVFRHEVAVLACDQIITGACHGCGLVGHILRDCTAVVAKKGVRSADGAEVAPCAPARCTLASFVVKRRPVGCSGEWGGAFGRRPRFGDGRPWSGGVRRRV